jgi:hypothetical protein
MSFVVIAYDDVYVPEWAAFVLAGLIGLSDEDCAVTITLAAYEAEGELERN